MSKQGSTLVKYLYVCRQQIVTQVTQPKQCEDSNMTLLFEEKHIKMECFCARIKYIVHAPKLFLSVVCIMPPDKRVLF